MTSILNEPEGFVEFFCGENAPVPNSGEQYMLWFNTSSQRWFAWKEGKYEPAFTDYQERCFRAQAARMVSNLPPHEPWVVRGV